MYEDNVDDRGRLREQAQTSASGVTAGRDPHYSHVWMPPFVQEVFERFDRVIGCGHVSGLFVRPDLAAGRYGDARILRRSNHRALSSLGIHAFLDPDLTDQLTLPFGDLLTRPTLPRLLELI